MDIEKSSFTKDGKSFIKSVLGKEVLNKENINYIFEYDCKIHYNKDNKKFVLLIPEEVKISSNLKKIIIYQYILELKHFYNNNNKIIYL